MIPNLLSWLIFLLSYQTKLLSKAEDDVIVTTLGSNSCPANYEKILSSKWACIAAMSIADPNVSGNQNAEMFNEEEKEPSFPSGCYECPKNTKECSKGTWFNTHQSGNANKDARLFCAKNTLSLENPDNGIIFMGDSDVDYWYNSEQSLPGSFNYGVGGNTCNKVHKEFVSLLKSVQNVQYLVLVCGENDLADGVKVNAVFKRFKKIYNTANKKGVRIVMMGTKPEPSTKNLHKKYEQYDKKLKRFAKSKARKSGGTTTPPFIFIDSYKSFESLGNPISLYANDKIHLSTEGYKYWNEWLQNAYDNALCDEDSDDCKCYIWEGETCVTKSL